MLYVSGSIKPGPGFHNFIRTIKAKKPPAKKTSPDPVDYHKVVVKKPWGYEYLMYENGTVGVWFLKLNGGAKTSMHCHPNKKTGLIILEGEAELSFLHDSTTLKPISKMMIREGLFHCTRAVSPGGITMIERSA